MFIGWQIETSISLPCTLRRCKNAESLRRGSNNCRAWALNFQQLSKKAEILEARGMARAKASSPQNVGTADNADNESIDIDNYDCESGSIGDTDYTLHQPKEDGDDEYLLPNEHSSRIDASTSMEKSECCVRSRRNSRVSEPQCSNTAGTKGNSEWIMLLYPHITHNINQKYLI